MAVVVGHVRCSLAAEGASLAARPARSLSPTPSRSPILGCHSATYFRHIEHIQAWLSSKGTP